MVDNSKKYQKKDEDALMGKVPPQAIDVEKAVLGALMLDRDAYYRISDLLDTSSFYKKEHQVIFGTIKKLATANKPVDLLTVVRALKDSNSMDEVGGPMYITELTSRIISAAHIEHHARIIAQKFIQRELIRIATEIQTESYDDSMDIDDLLNEARNKIYEVDCISSSSNLGQTSQVVAKDAIKEIEKDYIASKQGVSPGITTGLSDLNIATGGWRRGNLIILAARPSVGKSSLALHFSVTAAKSGKWVNFYGLEMKNNDYFRILLSDPTDIKRTMLRDGSFHEEDWGAIHKATASLEGLNIIWNDNTNITASQIQANTIRNKRAGKCDLVVIDYLQLLRPTDKKAIREQQIAEMTRTLKVTAVNEDIPVIALSQLNRDVEKRSDKEPNLSDLRESGAIEQDADVVLFLWDQESPKLKIGKQRRGRIGKVDFWANDEKTKFADCEPSSFDYKSEVPNSIPVNKDFDKQTGNDLPF